MNGNFEIKTKKGPERELQSDRSTRESKLTRDLWNLQSPIFPKRYIV
jgi:hypothetical protein